MPGRNFSSNSYRYGFNGQEKSDEIADGLTTALFWEYDSRTGRRWNTDPEDEPFESPYACLNNSPIFKTDPLGNTPGFWGKVKDFISGSKEAVKQTIDGVKKLATKEGLKNLVKTAAVLTITANTPGALGVMNVRAIDQKFGTNLTPTAVGLNNTADKAVKHLKNIKNWNAKQWGRNLTHVAIAIVGPKGVNIAVNTTTKLATGITRIAKVSEATAAAAEGSSVIAETTAAVETVSASGAQYSVAFQTKIPSSLYPSSTGAWSHFKAANQALLDGIESDACFANTMQDLGITANSIPRLASGAASGGKIPNFVWHHNLKPGIMELVPQIQHTNGSIFWNTMHPAGKGGMSIWGGGY